MEDTIVSVEEPITDNFMPGAYEIRILITKDGSCDTIPLENEGGHAFGEIVIGRNKRLFRTKSIVL